MAIWTCKEAFQSFFSQHVVHRLPTTVRPKIGFQPLDDVLSRSSGPVPSADT